ncbi:hypothetical protein O6H91_19G062900 [Diphasiastrum complanatum]|uniref:Uncharacterized protein n=1 Tax=Diphasiastrum complanatum TaxID=34168 RepID=A0ACC2AVW1_DIPCM|nr:hypothetical protein O6H91_19G062900 [Diphasiastrum complanatum]
MASQHTHARPCLQPDAHQKVTRKAYQRWRSLTCFPSAFSPSAPHGNRQSMDVLHQLLHIVFSINVFPSTLFSVFPYVCMLQMAGPLLINQLECAGNKPFRFTKKLFSL